MLLSFDMTQVKTKNKNLHFLALPFVGAGET